MSVRRRINEYEEEFSLSQLDPFDQIVYQFALVSQVTSGIRLSKPYITTTTSADRILDVLKSVRAKDFESGLSSKEISQKTGLAVRTITTALRSLMERGVVLAEKRGRRIKYYLPPEVLRTGT